MKIPIFIILMVALVQADTCAGNCVIYTNRCPTCPCGYTRYDVDVNQWCSKYTWDQACCRCIINMGSGRNPNAVFFSEIEDYNVGLWLIDQDLWPQCNNRNPPCDVQQNLNCAIKKYQKGGNSWKYWPWQITTRCGC